MNLKLIRLFAWSCLFAVAIVTIVPIGARPETALPPSYERFAVFAVMGMAFAVAYPRHFWLAVLVTIGAALLLELLQILSPTRHGRLFDAAIKFAGGSAGLMLGFLWQRLRRRAAA